MRRSRVAIALFALLFWLGCGSDPADKPASVLIDLDKSNEKRLLDYYFSGYFTGEPKNPFEAGLVQELGGDFYLSNPRTIADVASQVTQLYDEGAVARRIDWDLFENWVMGTWYEARGIPESTAQLRKIHGDWSDQAKWFVMSVRGSMSPFPRRIAVPLHQLETAVRTMDDAESAVIYPVGTVFIGEHLQSERVVETTVMTKRPDGKWDFSAYGKDGQLITRIHKEPDPLNVPTNCLGCHFGSRQFEPEESFPGNALPGPNGPRAIQVGDEFRHAGIAGTIREHTRRSDTVLGLYATLYLSKLAHERSMGTIRTEDLALLQRLGL